MKHIQTIFKALIILIMINACTENENLDFINSVVAPTNVTAIINISQDNTGDVKITPNAEGATFFNIFFDDSTTTSLKVDQGKSVSNTYAEGTYNIKIVAHNSIGKTTEFIQPLVVSFKAPENLMVSIENDANTSKQVNVKATADFAATYEFYSGETGVSQPVLTGNIGETINYQYADAGEYNIRVIAKGGAIQTTEFTQSFIVTEILAPLTTAPNPSNRNATDVVSIFSDQYANEILTELPTSWSVTGFEATTIDNNNVWKLTNLDFLGIVTNYTNGIDLSSMEKMHIDYWVPEGTTNGLSVKIVNTIDGGEGEASLGTTVGGTWQSIELDITAFDAGNLSNKEKITQLLIDSDGLAGVVYIDNFYFYKEPSMASNITGTWKIAPEAGSLRVGPSRGSGEWWSIDDAGVAQRACYYDDEYVFGTDFSFKNVLQEETWIEGWQGGSENCGAPVAPHNGGAATFIHNVATNKLTINGEGSYLGLPKVLNTGELPEVTITSSITYDIVLSNNNTEMEVNIEAGTGVFWTYKMIKEDTAPNTSPVDGTWKVASEAGSLKVGPSAGSGEWFAIDDAGVTQRACYFDDEYVFSNGTFKNILQEETWIEGWQGGADNCGTPVTPHNGSVAATFVFDASANTIQLNGKGAYLGLPKVNNVNELTNPDNAPESITYNVTFSNNNTVMDVVIEAGSGVFWSYKLVKQ